MLHSWPGRIAGVVALLAVLFALVVGFGSLGPAPELGAYPDGEALAQEYDAHVGDEIQVTGTVVRTDPVAIAVEYDFYADGGRHTGVLELTVTAVSTAVSEGETVQVYGTLQSDRTVVASNSVAIPAANFASMYVVSALAGVWTLGRLVCGWRIDWRRGAFRRRDDPLTPGRSALTAVREALD
ncbi:hypothetical protein [Haloarcula salina]|uniref:Uncharacterized protein n=1 Tax=Haloarcula salina TaxID=1429914 RepID=A0AA41FYD4_9EURY|nr:hypothetical protein [Haloarcula salina]MBV0900861.1 hypothetical protein [Haloarcula salina]